MALNINVAFPVEIDESVEGFAIEHDSSSLLGIDITLERPLTEWEVNVLISVLLSWQAGNGGYLVDLNIDESLEWNEDRTEFSLWAVWDFLTADAGTVLNRYFAQLEGLPIRSARLDSIVEPPED